MIPTFNEAENIQSLIREIIALPLSGDLHVLVVDDSSPDGTGDLVQKAAAADPRVHLLVRKKRRGRGAAGIDGFKAALALGADVIVEMDGDFSHQPRFIPALLGEMGRCDVAIGSRFVRGGADSDRSLIRRAITWLVRRFIRRRFRTSIRDVSSGFRCFSRGVLERLDPDDLISSGPSIVLEILYKLILMDASIHEVPIVFIDRKRGRTKLSGLTLLETLLMTLKFRRLDP
ncbi:MAG: polyprenol monophosphomannose synthase [Candidatus Aminicenantes bacterium]|nr:polyprenol monophosphomannose synthase [Candidatus Aminicenantes bacterium]